MGRLDGKIALTTGTAGGVGRAAALLFAAEGASVVGCDLKEAESAETVELVRAASGEMTAMAPVDLSTADGARHWVEDAVAAYEGVDVLFNNASNARVGPFTELDAETWRYVIQNELDLVYHVTWAAWPHLAERGGCVINAASIAAGAARRSSSRRRTARPRAACSRSPNTWRRRAEHRIRANAILPGMIRTPSTEHLFQDPDHPVHQLAASNPLGRVGHAEDVAKVALFLASDDAWYVNAAAIPVDGGQSVIV
jgi:NAD(P)-dependent dehydrogenase (short-subunit alcohol dehydrogenase family)